MKASFAKIFWAGINPSTRLTNVLNETCDIWTIFINDDEEDSTKTVVDMTFQHLPGEIITFIKESFKHYLGDDTNDFIVNPIENTPEGKEIIVTMNHSELLPWLTRIEDIFNPALNKG